ncbi:MAG: hypothetical protein CMO55_09805 [Verrucomicrobiales bacterium]|nr:hypothetical protein [Verrucomicrobiales bacterium]
MLTQIRHIQKGTLIVVTIIIVIAFAFLYSDYDSSAVGGQDCRVKVYDRCYREKEANKLATSYQVAIDLGMYDFATVLFGPGRMDDDPTDFMMSLVVLRHEAEKLGISPSATEIKEAIPKLPIFQQPWVTAEIVQNNILGPNGFTEADLAQLVKDYLSYQKLRELVSAGVEAVPSESVRRYTKRNQRYTGSVIRFNRNDFDGDVKVTDEEIKTYYEENKDTLLSDERRGFEYVKFTPKELKEDATNEQTAKADLQFANAVNRAYSDLAEDGANFVEVAKSYSGENAEFTLETGTFEPFSSADPPEEIAGNSEILTNLFSSTTREDEVTVPFQTEDKGYFVFHLSEVVAPEPLTLEQAKEAIKTALTAKKSNSQVSDAANAALAKIKEAMDSGKSFGEAAKAAGAKPEALPAFSEADPPAGIPDSSLILSAVEGLGPKEVSGVVERPNGEGYAIVYVDKIEIWEDEGKEGRLGALSGSIKSRLDRQMFAAWFNQRRQESGAVRPESLMVP